MGAEFFTGLLVTTRRRHFYGRVIWEDTGDPFQGSLTGTSMESGSGQGTSWIHWLPSTGEFEVGVPPGPDGASTNGPAFGELKLWFMADGGEEKAGYGWFSFDPKFDGL